MFHTRLRALREEAGYRTQKSFGEAFGVAQTTVANWEGGKREPNYETTLRLAEFFGTSTDYLMGRSDQRQTAEREIRDEDLMAAFWGGEKDLSPEEMAGMWDDVRKFAGFVAEQKKREKDRRDE